MTSDLDAAFPATAARQMGFDRIAMLSTYEMDVPDSLRKCIRVLMHIQTDKKMMNWLMYISKKQRS